MSNRPDFAKNAPRRARLSPRSAAASLATAAVALTVVAAGAPSRADVTIVSKVTTTGAPGMMGAGGAPGGDSGSKETTVKTFYKGRKVRTETQGRILLYDGATGHVYALNPANKTYFTLGGDSQNPFAKMMKMSTTATVAPTGATRTIAGRAAREYSVSATIDMSINAGAFGAPPGAAGAAPSASAPPQHVGSIKIVGRQWVATIASLPNGGGDAMRASAEAMNAIPGMKGLLDKLTTIKGVPLASQQTVTTQFAFPGAPANNAAAAKAGKVVTSNTETVSLTEGPLADALFALPAGYRNTPMTGGMRGGGGPRSVARPMSATP